MAFPDSPRIDPDDRSGRGIRHDVTGKLLCPIKYDWDDDEWFMLFFWLTVDQNAFWSVREKLRDFSPEYNYTGDFLLRCFYTNFEGDVRQPEKGFLKSLLLVKVSLLARRSWKIFILFFLVLDIQTRLHISCIC